MKVTQKAADIYQVQLQDFSDLYKIRPYLINSIINYERKVYVKEELIVKRKQKVTIEKGQIKFTKSLISDKKLNVFGFGSKGEQKIVYGVGSSIILTKDFETKDLQVLKAYQLRSILYVALDDLELYVGVIKMHKIQTLYQKYYVFKNNGLEYVVKLLLDFLKKINLQSYNKMVFKCPNLFIKDLIFHTEFSWVSLINDVHLDWKLESAYTAEYERILNLELYKKELLIKDEVNFKMALETDNLDKIYFTEDIEENLLTFLDQIKPQKICYLNKDPCVNWILNKGFLAIKYFNL